MNLKRFVLFSIIFILLVSTARDEDPWQRSLEKISTMVSVIEENYYRDFDYEKAVHSSIALMLQTLDPHSNFLDLRNFMRLREDYQGKYHGLGIMIQKHEDRLVVITPLEGTPAYRLGIQAGDIISHIEGESTKPLSSYEAMQRLRGPKNTEVTITIVRESMDEPFDVTITRAEIPLASISYSFILKEDTGYIFIRNFGERTTTEFKKAMQDLVGQGMTRLILDMRYNPGGTFAQSIELSEELLPKGAQIVSIKGRRRQYNREYYALYDGQYEHIPVVILINESTASAPEIISGAVQDNDRGLIVGMNSWGKGLVQTVFPLSVNEALSLTTAQYFTPSGRSIQRDYTYLEEYILNTEVPEEDREVRYTRGGRKVLGQGGIAPDYESKITFKETTVRLRFKGTFFNYARRFHEKETPLARKWKMPPGSQKDIVINEQILDDYKSYLAEKKISVEEDEFNDAINEIKRELKRELTTVFWGLPEGERVYRLQDPVVLKALEVMPEAEALVKYESK